MTTPETRHDSQCENLPGGQYHGKTVGEVFGGTSTMTPIPCHCPARASGRIQAEAEMVGDLARLADLLAATPAGPDHDAIAAEAQAIADQLNKSREGDR